MKKMIIFLLLIVGIPISLMPVSALGVRQGFQHPDKSWAPKLVYVGARIRMRCARYQSAASILEKAQIVWKNYEKTADGLYWIGLCYERAGSTALAIARYKAFLARYPQHRWAAQARHRLETLEAETL